MSDAVWLSTKEAAEFCGVYKVPARTPSEKFPNSRPRLFGIVFPFAHRDGHRYKFLKSDLEAWKSERQRINPPERTKHRKVTLCAECGDAWPCNDSLKVKAQRCTAANCNVIVRTGGLCAIHSMWAQVLEVIT